MIPILYEGNETNFTSNGLGRLADAISCKVVEERNATYELEMTYPVSGAHYSDLTENRIILAQPFDGGLTQPFIIYKITKPLNGVVTVNAEHISYRLSGFAVMPFEANTPAAALAGIKTYSATTNPFNFTTDKTNIANFKVEVPTGARELLCGSSGSILDVYGKGDYEFNRFDVNLRVNRGLDNGVTIRYGKNLTDLKNIIDTTGVYTGIAPYWADGEGNVVTLPEKVILSDHVSEFPFKIIKSVDMSEKWENAPTVAQLRSAAQSYVTSNEGWKIKNNIDVSFVALWNTEEYKDIAPLERVKMCDIVHIVYPKLGINFQTKVIRTDYDVLQEKYNAITLGDSYYTLGSVFTEEIARSQEEQSSHMQKAIAHATKLITGGLGGHVVFNLNADGEPQEILIMDTDNIQTAVSVIRMNKNGIGFSTNGYNGPFHTAWTIDGHFVADYIDSGTLNADIIKAGILQDEAGNNYWNMITGDFQLSPRALVGGSTVASKADVTNGDASTLASAQGYARNEAEAAKQYAANEAANAEADAKAYAASQDAVVLTAAQVYANNGITNYDTYLNQTKVFSKLTDNGRLQGIYMQNGDLYINGNYIKAGTIDASLVNVTNINATNIKTGVLGDASGNTSWNLSTGALSSKKLSINSTYFELTEQGKITSMSPDGKKIVLDKGTITGYMENGNVSAVLEVSNGCFNIANGVLKIQGVEGISGNTSFVKGISYEEASIGNLVNSMRSVQVVTGLGTLNLNVASAYAGGSVTSTGTFSGTCTVDGKTGTCSGTVTVTGQASLPVNIIGSISGYPQTEYVGSASNPTTIKYAKAVSASTGFINSKYGIIQSIS